MACSNSVLPLCPHAVCNSRELPVGPEPVRLGRHQREDVGGPRRTGAADQSRGFATAHNSAAAGALAAALNYAVCVTIVPHAIHMPSHTYVLLGRWPPH
jgi:hypothetical protein